jgi:ribosome-binding protein aMBF1 (putative translation factor)
MDSKLTGASTAAATRRAAPAARLRRRKPREFEEWKALVSWGRLPEWEERSAGYRLRLARENAGLTQAELAARLGVTQQAVARAERWDSNPTVKVLAAWADALGVRLELELRPGRETS